ncbi:MAG TPA: QacE family quaternary ammonium compound efflux SMR transporter, partial [Peptococcaceae bacterium]|nr:QacE family quaternary ammonium compound efflux SMR transporter [Peptococcaceae bacterium]
MAWVYLIIASFGEIFGMTSINLYIRKRAIPRILLVFATFGFGFFFLSLAMRTLPMGVSYAVWTGLGAAGAVLVGILFFKEEASWQRIFFLGCIITGAVGLR